MADARRESELPQEWEAAPGGRLDRAGAGRGVPGPGPGLHDGLGRSRPQPRGAAGAAARAQQPGRRRPGDQPAPAVDPLVLPRLLPPHRPRPRRDADPRRGGLAQPHARRPLQEPQPPRRRAHDRGRRGRGRADGFRRRQGRGPPRHAPGRRGRELRGPDLAADPGHDPDRRRAAPARRPLPQDRRGPRA